MNRRDAETTVKSGEKRLRHDTKGTLQRTFEYMKARRLVDAKSLLRRALAQAPDDAQLLHARGWIAHLEKDDAAAVKLIGRAARIAPSEWAFPYNLGRIHQSRGELVAAEGQYRRALELNPGFASIANDLGVLMGWQGRAKDAVQFYERALSLDPGNASIFSNYLFQQHLLDDCDAAALFSAHVRFGRQFARPAMADLRRIAEQTPARRLRIGYVSADFRDNYVAKIIESVIAHHDRETHEIICYSCHPVEDHVTARLRSHVDRWRTIASVGDEDAARMIHVDAIDILVDLAGHTGGNRLPVFAFKPAPIQVSWLGYFNTTGLDAIDYLISDPISSPPDDRQKFVETLVRLPHVRVCYHPPEDAPPVALLPALARGSVTFGTFNKLEKLNEKVIALWAQILRAVPDSRLLLKTASFTDEAVGARCREQFHALGVAAERLLLRPFSPHLQMLTEYSDIDVALDPFPYTGGLTTCDALWQGVPVLTLLGDSMSSRQSASLLTAVGLPDWIAASREDYVARAVQAAGDLGALAELRGSLRARMAASPVCDAATFTRDLEGCYALMCNAHR